MITSRKQGKISAHKSAHHKNTYDYKKDSADDVDNIVMLFNKSKCAAQLVYKQCREDKGDAET